MFNNKFHSLVVLVLSFICFIIAKEVEAGSAATNINCTQVSPGRYQITGTVVDSNGKPACGLALASGRCVFSCGPGSLRCEGGTDSLSFGQFNLTNLPTETNGKINMQTFVSGSLPGLQSLDPSNGCAIDGGGRGGLWSGSIIQFFVSSDGGRITSTGSPIKTSDGTPAGLKLGPVKDTGCGYTVTNYFLGDNVAAISGNQFSKSTGSGSFGSLQINGYFSSSTASNGTYVMSGYNSIDRCTSQGSGSWTATKSGANAMSLGSSPMNYPIVEKLYDTETGAYIGVMEIYK